MKHDTPNRSGQGTIPKRTPMFNFRNRWGYKRCRSPMAFQHREDPEITLVVEHSCRKPSCPDCRPDWESRWLWSTMGHWGFVPLTDDEGWEVWDEHGEAQWVYASRRYRPVYVSTVVAVDFEATRRTIKNHGCEYMAISPDQSSGDVILFTNDKGVGARVRRDAAPGILKVAISMASGHAKCITSSKGWKLPPRRRPKPEWRRIPAAVKVTVDDLSRALKKWRKPFTASRRKLAHWVCLVCQADELERLITWLECGITREYLANDAEVT